MRLLNPRINFLFIADFLSSSWYFFVVVSSHYVSAKFHHWPSSGDQPAFLFETQDAVNHLKKARGEIWSKRSEKKQQKNYQDEDKKSAINKKINSQQFLSLSYRAGSTDIPDPISPLLPIVHRPR